MRYVKARKDNTCVVCKEPILKGDVCIQSQGQFYYMYHEACHQKRFGSSIFHAPNNQKPD